MRVLVIEDYFPIRRAVAQGLTEANIEVETAADGKEGLWMATSFPFDVIVLDLMLPEVDGLTILKKIRKENNKAHVIILTARDAVDDRIHGLNCGADDYLTKPFEFGELLARVRALIRRRYGQSSPSITIDDLEIDTLQKQVTRANRPIDLTPREYSLLEYLAHRTGEVVSRTDIWEHVYDLNGSGTSNVVDVYIAYLRKKLEPAGARKLIHTRRGLGYCLGVRE